MDEKLQLINNYLSKLQEINNEQSNETGGIIASSVSDKNHSTHNEDMKGKEKINRPPSPRDPFAMDAEVAGGHEKISSSARSSVADKKRQGLRQRSDSNTSSIASVARSSVATTTTGGGKKTIQKLSIDLC
jgi:hypothetical protein